MPISTTNFLRLFLSQRRAQRVDSARQLDLFADLNLGESDDEGQADESGVVRMGIAAYASLLPEAPAVAPPLESSPGPETPTERKKKKKRKQKAKRETPAASSKWADQCMYAELLEMSEDDPWSASTSQSGVDGLPEDLETGWVAGLFRLSIEFIISFYFL